MRSDDEEAAVRTAVALAIVKARRSERATSVALEAKLRRLKSGKDPEVLM